MKRLSLTLLFAVVIALPLSHAFSLSNVEKEVKTAATFVERLHYDNAAFLNLSNDKFIDSLANMVDSNKNLITLEDISTLKKKFPDSVTEIKCGELPLLTPVTNLLNTRQKERVAYSKNYIESLTALPHFPKVFVQEDRPATLSELHTKWQHVLSAKALQIAVKEPALEFPAIKEKLLGVTTRLENQVKTFDETTFYPFYLNAWLNLIDPHSFYFTKEALAKFEINLSQQLYGVGILLETDGEYNVIKDIVPGSPASTNSEIKKEGRIVAVNNIPVIYKSLEELVQLIRGEKGTPVTLSIDYPTQGTSIVELTRAEINIESQRVKGTIKDNVLILTIPTFYVSSGTSVSKDVEKLLKDNPNVQGVVLDFRDNGGGQLTEALNILRLFTSADILVQVEDSKGLVSPKSTLTMSTIYKGPVVVLINRFSASASEIIAGTLQDYKRAVILGDDQSYGKGSVQSVSPFLAKLLPLNGSLKITVQRYYLPSGRSIQTTGVKSDFVIPSTMQLYGLKSPHNKTILDKEKRVSPAPNYDAFFSRHHNEFLFTGNNLAATYSAWQKVQKTNAKDITYVNKIYNEAETLDSTTPELTLTSFTSQKEKLTAFKEETEKPELYDDIWSTLATELLINLPNQK